MILVQVSPGCYRQRVPSKANPDFHELGAELSAAEVDQLVRQGQAVKVLTDIGGGNMRSIPWAEHKRQPQQPLRPQSAARSPQPISAPSASYRPPAALAQPAAPQTKIVRTIPDEAHSMGPKQVPGIPDSAYRV